MRSLFYHANDQCSLSQDELNKLIDECGCNDRSAQETVYKYFYKEMYVICNRYAEHRHDTQTILNDGFLKAFKNIARYNNNLGQFDSWLKTIMINTAIDHTRSIKRKSNTIPIDHAPEQGNDDFGLNFIVQKQDISRHLNLLPAVTKMVINLSAFEGYPYKDIAALLGISESTARWHVGEARKKLKQSLQIK